MDDKQVNFDVEQYAKSVWVAPLRDGDGFKRTRNKEHFQKMVVITHQEKEVPKINKTTDIIACRIKKLAGWAERHPDKEIPIPERRKEYVPRPPREFNRNVYGSSSGVGSSDFHVYRGIRRRENQRIKYAEFKKAREEADFALLQKRDSFKSVAEQKTAKRRAKRQRYKAKHGKKKPTTKKTTSDSDESDDDEDDEEDDGVDRTLDDDDGKSTKDSEHSASNPAGNKGDDEENADDAEHDADGEHDANIDAQRRGHKRKLRERCDSERGDDDSSSGDNREPDSEQTRGQCDSNGAGSDKVDGNLEDEARPTMVDSGC